MSAAQHTPGPAWEIKRQVSLLSGQTTGFMVERVHRPGTDDAKAEVLRVDGRNRWSSQKAALDAIAKAGGAA